MKSIIVYGSCYGTTKCYAEALAQKIGIKAIEYSELKDLTQYDTVIYMGGLYAGGVWGLKKNASLLPTGTNQRLLIGTVGLADPQDERNITNIREGIRRQVPQELYGRAEFFHLRGGMDYQKLNWKHRTMMKMMYLSIQKTPQEKRGADAQDVLGTYQNKVDFVDLTSLEPVVKLYHQGENPQ